MPSKTEIQQLRERITKMIDDANHSRPGSRETIRKFMEDCPGLSVLEDFGNAAQSAERELVNRASGGNVLVDETTRSWIAEVRAELVEPGDTELEKMLVQRTVLCWLSVNTAEQLRAKKWEGSIVTEAADFWDRHVSRLQSDFLRACRMLATVRRLRRPTLQMNIAEKQVNVAK